MNILKARLKLNCGKCKYLCSYPFFSYDLKVEIESFYLDKENTIFECRPKFAMDCKKERIAILSNGRSLFK